MSAGQGRWRRRDEVIAVGLALLAGLPLLLGRTYAFDDALELGLPLFAALQRAVEARRWLVWNPDMFGGYHGLGAGQSGSYYPPHLLLLSFLPTLTAFRCSYLLHFWLLARGSVGLGRELGYTTRGVLVTAAVATLGGATAGHVIHHNVIIGLAWSAPILWLSVVVARSERFWPTLMLGGCYGLALLGSHPQYVWFSLVASLAVAPWQRAVWMPPGRLAARLLAGPLLGALLATAQLLPLFEYARFYPRPQPGSPLGYLTAGSFGLREWLRLLQPDLFGSPLDGSYGPEGFLYWETRGFCGLLFLTLAVARILARRLDGPARAGLSLVLIALLLLPGRYNPLYFVLVHLPPFSLFRIPGRWVWLLQWGVALLAGGGVTALAQRRLPRRAVTQAAIAVLFALLTALVVAGLERVEALPLAALLTMGLAALLLVLLVPVSRLTAARRRRAMRLMLAVGLLELVVSWHGFARTRPAKDLEEPPRLLRPVLLDDNKRLLESGLAVGTDPRVVSNSGLLWGAAYLRGGREALMPTPQLAVLQDLDQARAGSSGRFQFYLDRYSVRWLVTSQPVSDPSLREVLTEQGATLYENTDARPLAYALSPRYLSAGEVTTSPEQFVDVHRVEVAEQSPDRWRLRTRFPRPMVVVLSQSAYPGWLALVDGEPSQLFGAERLFMATLVPAGEHEVTFLFDNAQVWLGRALNGLALVAWLLALMVTLARPISPRPRSREPLPES